ncbi:MAG: cyanophycinase [Planctomycetota bacterium]
MMNPVKQPVSMIRWILPLSFVAWLSIATSAPADDADRQDVQATSAAESFETIQREGLAEQYSHWPEDLKINGRIIVYNEWDDLRELRPLLERTLKSRSVLSIESSSDPQSSNWSEALAQAAGDSGSFTTLSSANASTNLLSAAIDAVDCVCMQSVPGGPDGVLGLSDSLHALIQRGGMLIADLSVARRFGKYVFPPNDKGKCQLGLNLLPDCLVESTAQRSSMLEALQSCSPAVGISMDEGTVMMLSGRKILSFGSGSTTLSVVAETAKSPMSVSLSSATENRRRAPQRYMADLTQWRRIAIDRQLPPFPGEQPPAPYVENGTLIIIGGGGSPRTAMRRFMELAGGTQSARLLYVPCSEKETVGERHGMVENWKRMGVQHATFIHSKDRRQANSDPEFLSQLKGTTGIFFGGGRQWNFSDSYYGTRTHAMMKDVLRRGGVIAGSSAGASIQGRYLARATPIGNFDIMAPGYERGGLGFLPGVAIDQHFSQRGRQKDMQQLVRTYPQLLGIGIDESTAIEVQKSEAKVSGRGRVFFYDNRDPTKEEPTVIALPAGSVYDLQKRKVLVDTRKEE